MTNQESIKKTKPKWWLHPMDPENLVELSERDKRHAKNFNHWLLVWGILFFGVVNTMQPISNEVGSIPYWRWLLILAPMTAGVFLVRSFKKLFWEMNDELMRQIHLNALAIGFLSAFFLGMGLILWATVIGTSIHSGPIIFTGLLAGYFFSLLPMYRKYHA